MRPAAQRPSEVVAIGAQPQFVLDRLDSLKHRETYAAPDLEVSSGPEVPIASGPAAHRSPVLHVRCQHRLVVARHCIAQPGFRLDAGAAAVKENDQPEPLRFLINRHHGRVVRVK